MRSANHLVLFMLSISLGAGCDDAAPGGGGGSGGGPETLAQLLGANSLALDDACVYASTGFQIHCVARDDGRARVVGDLPAGLLAVEIAADGRAVFATALSSTFGPGGDRQLRVLRFPAGGGSPEEPGRVFAGFAAGQLVLDDDFVYVTSGGTAQLTRFPKAGGDGIVWASDSGNFGDVALAADRLVYDNNGLYAVPVAGGDETPLSASADGDQRLAGWGTSVLAWGGLASDATLLRVPLDGGAPQPLFTAAQPGGELAVAGDQAWVIAGTDLVRVGLADGRATTEAAAERPVDVVADGGAVYWSTLDGRLRQLTIGE